MVTGSYLLRTLELVSWLVKQLVHVLSKMRGFPRPRLQRAIREVIVFITVDY